MKATTKEGGRLTTKEGGRLTQLSVARHDFLRLNLVQLEMKWHEVHLAVKSSKPKGKQAAGEGYLAAS